MQAVRLVVRAILLGVIVGALIGVVFGVAWAQATDPSTPDPTASLIAELLRTGGMPATLLWLGWRAAVGFKDGIPVVVSLSAEDRVTLRKAMRAVVSDDEERLVG